MSLRVTNRLSREHAANSPALFKPAAKLILKDKIWINNSICEIFKGILEGPFSFLPSILLFMLVHKESSVSVNIFATGIITVISNSIFGRTKTNTHIKLMLLATNVLFATSGIMLIKSNATTITILSLLYAFFSLYLQNPPMKMFYILANSDENHREITSELYALRGYFSALGKLIGIILVFWIAKFNNGLRVITPILAVSQYATWYFCKKTANSLKCE
jgi:predicted MFS family arabinose efflux permease